MIELPTKLQNCFAFEVNSGACFVRIYVVPGCSANSNPVALSICAPIHENTFCINWFGLPDFCPSTTVPNPEIFHKRKAGCLTTAGGHATKSEALISSQENGARSPDPPPPIK